MLTGTVGVLKRCLGNFATARPFRVPQVLNASQFLWIGHMQVNRDLCFFFQIASTCRQSFPRLVSRFTTIRRFQEDAS